MQKNGCGLSRLLEIIIAQSYVRMLLTQNPQHNHVCAFLSLKLGNYLLPDAVVPKTDFESSCVGKSTLKTDIQRKYVGIDSNAHLYKVLYSRLMR